MVSIIRLFHVWIKTSNRHFKKILKLLDSNTMNIYNQNSKNRDSNNYNNNNN